MKIRGEQKELAEERDALEKMLKIEAKLHEAGPRRAASRTPRSSATRAARRIVEREAAQAIDETELVTDRAGDRRALRARLGARRRRGTTSTRATLSYKAGDAFLAAARGRSNQLAVFLDSTGRAYSLPAHTLPSARGQGEPLSGRLDPPEGATFAGVLIGEPDDKWLLACDAGLRLHRAARGAHRPEPRRQDRVPPARERQGAAGGAGARGATARSSPRSTATAACWRSRWRTCRKWRRAAAT